MRKVELLPTRDFEVGDTPLVRVAEPIYYKFSALDAVGNGRVEWAVHEWVKWEWTKWHI